MKFDELPYETQLIAARLLADKFDSTTTEPAESLARRIGGAFIALHSHSEAALVQNDNDQASQ